MLVAVYDTYVVRGNGQQMHFDILVEEATDKEQVLAYLQAYLQAKGITTQQVRAQKCMFCHIESPTADVISAIRGSGFHILELEGCG